MVSHIAGEGKEGSSYLRREMEVQIARKPIVLLVVGLEPPRKHMLKKSSGNASREGDRI